jgi:predicted GNAT superfamily acetyltransferase
MDDPRETARQAAEAAGVEIRTLSTLEEAGEVVRLQREAWGEGQLVPRELIRAFQGAGIPPLGARSGTEIVGFVLGFIGAGEDGLHVHSHQLAVTGGGRSRGVGRALKLAQRAWALDQGIPLMRWTFDPLIARNAYFNLHVLGTVADRFHRHYYGDMGDDVNRGQRSDRLEVRWDLRETPGPREVREPGARVSIPEDHEVLRTADPERARDLRDSVANELDSAIAGGLVALAFDREASAYLLARPGSG